MAVRSHIERIFEAPSAKTRAEAVGRLFVEELDFHPADREVSLAGAPKRVTLPSDAYHVASLDTAHVVYVALNIPGIERVRKAEAAEAARLISEQIDGDLLLIFTNTLISQLHLIYPTFVGKRPTLRRMVVERYLPQRTAIQQIANIYHQSLEKESIHIALESAFDVEAVTKRFFTEYKRVFDAAMEKVWGFGQSQEESEDKRLFVQTLFNRLMFVYFLSRKGWLTFKNDKDYLNALWKDYAAQDDETNFYNDRLYHLFFFGLNNPQSQDLNFRNSYMESIYGSVPFLNGGLFEETALDKRAGIVVPDEAVKPILTDLFNRFNFTVMESTPFDIEVAVDPEMLGKVFEELVTGRHESGSYYTPRPVVAFMCREALKGYLAGENTGLPDEAIANFVDDHDARGISITDAQKLADTLKEVTVVDPACGSGAYLLGMMQELVELQTALFSDQLLADAQSLYDLKLRIIQRNLYGVDIDPFATNIAMLRLWLALAIEYEGKRPEPLPNLDFKIVCGDSLLGPDPDPKSFGDLFRAGVHQAADALAALKDEFMGSTGAEKDRLKEEVEELQDQLKSARAEVSPPLGVVDWSVEFAEVFEKRGGFDIVVANPPYVRQEQIGPNKDALKKEYASAVTARSDLYCYFYARALQMLRGGGMHVFVCSNSWLDVGYGAKLQEYLLKNSHVRAVYESAVERQFATAQINTIISIIEKTLGVGSHRTRFVSLRKEFEKALANAEGRREITVTNAELMEAGKSSPDTRGQQKFVGDKWGGKYLRAPDIYWTIEKKGRGKLVRLGDVAAVKFGIKTGANEFFYLDRSKIEEWGIEGEFLKPVMISPRESRSIAVEREQLENKIFLCHEEKRDLAGTAALDYILWGELKGFHLRRSVSSRRLWYDLGRNLDTNLAFGCRVNTTSRTMLSTEGLHFDKAFYRIGSSTFPMLSLCAAMNSSLVQLMINVKGRVNLGGGLLEIDVNETQNLQIPYSLPKIERNVFQSAGWDVLNPSLERRFIDDAIFDELGLTQGERDAVYEGVTELVENRRRRARSV